VLKLSQSNWRESRCASDLSFGEGRQKPCWQSNPLLPENQDAPNIQMQTDVPKWHAFCKDEEQNARHFVTPLI
jgi:hypothetical protein